jgi:hypothetical protein
MQRTREEILTDLDMLALRLGKAETGEEIADICLKEEELLRELRKEEKA